MISFYKHAFVRSTPVQHKIHIGEKYSIPLTKSKKNPLQKCNEQRHGIIHLMQHKFLF